jgi:hypothetical protein
MWNEITHNMCILLEISFSTNQGKDERLSLTWLLEEKIGVPRKNKSSYEESNNKKHRSMSSLCFLQTKEVKSI